MGQTLRVEKEKTRRSANGASATFSLPRPLQCGICSGCSLPAEQIQLAESQSEQIRVEQMRLEKAFQDSTGLASERGKEGLEDSELSSVSSEGSVVATSQEARCDARRALAEGLTHMRQQHMRQRLQRAASSLRELVGDMAGLMAALEQSLVELEQERVQWRAEKMSITFYNARLQEEVTLLHDDIDVLLNQKRAVEDEARASR